MVMLASSLSLPILASWESMEKCLVVDGDFSHILLTFHIDLAGDGSSLLD